MPPSPIRTALFVLAAGAIAGVVPTPALAGGDVTVSGDHRSGEYGTGASQDSQSLAVSFVHGKRFQFHARLSALRLHSPFGVAVTSVGPVPLSPEHRQARGQASSPGIGSGHGGAGYGSRSKSDSIISEPASSVEAGGGGDWVSGMGDLRVGLAARLVGRPSGLYRLDADVTLKAPTADEERGLGTGEWDARVGLLGERRFWTCTAFAALGWNRFGDPGWIDLEDAADFFGGVESESIGPGLMISGWVNANSEIVPGAGSRVVLGGSVRSARRKAWRLSLSAGLTDAAEEIGLSFGYTFAGRTPRARAAEVAR